MVTEQNDKTRGSLANQFSTSKTYDALVIGAGPAGLAAVGTLLERGLTKLMWVDSDFAGGRIGKNYREVPSNTKVGLIIRFATSVAPFRAILSSDSRGSAEDEGSGVEKEESPLLRLRRLEEEGYCPLDVVADLCVELTKGLLGYEEVESHVARAEKGILDECSKTWTVQLRHAFPSKQAHMVSTRALILCTGSSPTTLPLPNAPTGLSLDTALSPAKLASYLSSNPHGKVGVIGASHSAVLVLRNLCAMAQAGHNILQVTWLTRRELWYAEYLSDGGIARDNTGLKGEAAEWARANLESIELSKAPEGFIRKISYGEGQVAEAQAFENLSKDVEIVIQAIGYTPNTLPELNRACNGHLIKPRFDHDHGRFVEDDGDRVGESIPRLFGAGIAFPEKVVCAKYGRSEMNVGFMGFMNALKRWMEHWDLDISSTRR